MQDQHETKPDLVLVLRTPGLGISLSIAFSLSWSCRKCFTNLASLAITYCFLLDMSKYRCD